MGTNRLKFVILHGRNLLMSLQHYRYKSNPSLADTTGFFDLYVPYTNQSEKPANDSVRQYYDFQIYDYIAPNQKRLDSSPSAGIFQGHQLAPKDQPRPVHNLSTDWITVLLIICLVIIAWIQNNYAKRLRQVLRSVALPYYINQLEREGNLYNERISLGLGFIFLVSTSLLAYKIFSMYQPFGHSMHEFYSFLIIFGGIVAFVALKGLLIKLTGIIFKTQEHAHAYRLNALIFNHTTGLFILPVLFFVFYWRAQPFIWIAICIISILLIYRFVRSIMIGISNTKFSVFYLILYLCTLEILPIVILVKLIRQF